MGNSHGGIFNTDFSVRNVYMRISKGGVTHTHTRGVVRVPTSTANMWIVEIHLQRLESTCTYTCTPRVNQFSACLTPRVHVCVVSP